MTTATDRRNAISAALRQHKPVCQHAVDQALEALEALEHAGDIATLQAIVVHASAAMLRLAQQPAPAPVEPTPVVINPAIVSPSVVVIDAPAPAPTPLPDIPDTMGTDDDGLPVDTTLQDLFAAADAIMAQPHYNDDDLSDAVAAVATYTIEQLELLPMPKLRVIGNDYGVKARSKRDLAQRIVAAIAEQA